MRGAISAAPDYSRCRGAGFGRKRQAMRSPAHSARSTHFTRRTLLSLSLLVLGCRSSSEAEPAPTKAADQTYQVRGVLASITPEKSTVEIQHEEIPDFANSSGKKVGMAAMTMPFHVAPQVDLKTFAVGDKVAFTLEVRWQEKRELYIPQMTTLPKDTALEVK
jgi:Cu/Ag efflux protein CusF